MVLNNLLRRNENPLLVEPRVPPVVRILAVSGFHSKFRFDDVGDAAAIERLVATRRAQVVVGTEQLLEPLFVRPIGPFSAGESGRGECKKEWCRGQQRGAHHRRHDGAHSPPFGRTKQTMILNAELPSLSEAKSIRNRYACPLGAWPGTIFSAGIATHLSLSHAYQRSSGCLPSPGSTLNLVLTVSPASQHERAYLSRSGWRSLSGRCRPCRKSLSGPSGHSGLRSLSGHAGIQSLSAHVGV